MVCYKAQSNIGKPHHPLPIHYQPPDASRLYCSTPGNNVSHDCHLQKIVGTLCQTIDHANHKAVQEKSRRKALQAEFEQSGGHGRGNRSTPCGGRGEGHGRNPRRGRPSSSSSGHGNGRTGGQYHNWIPREQVDNLDDAGYEQLVRDHVTRGELQANTNMTTPTPSTYTNNSQVQTTPPLSQEQVTQPSPADSQSVLTGIPTIPPTAPQTQTRSASMAMVTPSPTLHGSTMAASMDNGPNTLLRHLMSNASARSANAHHASPNDSESLTTMYNGHKYQVCKINNTIY